MALARLLLLAFSFARCAECGEPACSDGADGLALLQVSKPPAPHAAQEVIEKHFASVPPGGGSLRSNFVRSPGRLTSSAWECSEIDFNRFYGVNDTSVQALMEKFGVTRYCGSTEGGGSAPGDPSCKAFWAGLKAHLELQELGFDPVFKNFEVVNWWQPWAGHYASWGDTPLVEVDYAHGEVKSWQVLDKNAVSGYAFCDLVQGVLRQNADQAGTATCGPTAVLAALTQVNPAGAIKRGLEIFWTGTIPELPADAQPCEYLYSEVPPGVIPFLPGQPGTEGSAGRALLLPCLGNEADCEQAVDAPNTQAGLQGMWSLMFGSASDRRKTGGCSENYWYVRYPGRDPRENALVRMETSVADIMTLCDTVLGERGTCKYLTNYDLCDKVKLEDKEQCRRFHTIPGLTPRDMNAFELYEKHGAVPAPFGEIFQQSMAPGGRIHSFLAGVTALGLGAGELIAAVTMSSLSESVTEQLCSNPRGSLLFVYAGGLPASAPEEGHPFDGPGNPEYSACNHWVYAEGCNFGPEKDAVSIWTWGYRMYVTKNFLMTSNGGHPLVCGGILVP